MELTGTTGDDTLIGGSDDDTLSGSDGNDSLDGADGNDDLLGGSGADTIIGGLGDDSLEGGGGDDSMVGGAGDDTLYGGKGNDFMDGSQGGLLGDFAYYKSAVNPITVDLTTGVATDGWGSTDTLQGIENVIAGNYADLLVGNSSSNWFDPGKGDDTVDGAEGIDIVSFESATGGVQVDLVAGTATGSETGNDTLTSIEHVVGSKFDDVIMLGNADGELSGHDGDDALTGGAGNDTLIGGSGNDTIGGGDGVDTLLYTDEDVAENGPSLSGVGVTVDLATGTATDNWGDTDTFTGIEIVYGSIYGDVMTGGNVDNGIGVTDGFEAFEGGAGDDTINGGVGFDLVMYTTSEAAVKITLGGSATGLGQDGFGNSDLLTSIEGVLGSAFNDTLRGSDTGTFESFEGGAGNDSLNGFGGIDRVSYESSPGAVLVNLATTSASDGYGGTDIVQGIENVLGSGHDDTLTGSTAANELDGGAGSDSIVGGDGNDTLTGGDGDDTLDGGAGNDVAVFGQVFANYLISVDGVTGELIVSGPEGSDLLRNIEALQFADTTYTVVEGTEAAETLAGAGGAELIHGRDGDDSIDGGGGNDALYGDEGDDDLDGGDGNDVMDGGDGNDSMAGGTGDDTYFVDSFDDEVVEDADALGNAPQRDGPQTFDIGGGIDKVVASINYTLGNFVENLALAGTNNLAGNGNALANQLAGNAGNNVLTGAGGNDDLDGGAGIDVAAFEATRNQYGLTVGSESSQVDGAATGEGTDTLEEVERLQFADIRVALDLEGNAGEVAKILGAVFGTDSVANESFVGIGLGVADTNMTYLALMELALNYRLGAGASNTAVVELLYTNVVGVPPDDAARANFVALLDNHTYTQGELGLLAADHALNTNHINLAGLMQTGLEYL